MSEAEVLLAKHGPLLLRVMIAQMPEAKPKAGESADDAVARVLVAMDSGRVRFTKYGDRYFALDFDTVN